MKIIMNIKGIFLRRKYIKKFIDYKSDYYVENIKKNLIKIYFCIYQSCRKQKVRMCFKPGRFIFICIKL